MSEVLAGDPIRFEIDEMMEEWEACGDRGSRTMHVGFIDGAYGMAWAVIVWNGSPPRGSLFVPLDSSQGYVPIIFASQERIRKITPYQDGSWAPDTPARRRHKERGKIVREFIRHVVEEDRQLKQEMDSECRS